MSDSGLILRHKIKISGDMHEIVRAVKTLALANINQYDHAVRAISGYTKSLEISLGACFRYLEATETASERTAEKNKKSFTAVIFGSDHGLVGSFNDAIASFAGKEIRKIPGTASLMVVGERLYPRLIDQGFQVSGIFRAPESVAAITSMIGEILQNYDTYDTSQKNTELYVFYNQPVYGDEMRSVFQQILPINQNLRSRLMALPWPTEIPPEIFGRVSDTTRAFLREFIFVSLFKSCALSLASENYSRLEAMQRADKNIDELRQHLTLEYNEARQNEIDSELFDILSGSDNTAVL